MMFSNLWNKRKAIKTAKSWEGGLKTLSDELRSDPDIVLEAVKEYPGAFKFASPGLKNDLDFVLKVMNIFVDTKSTYFNKRGELLLETMEVISESLKDNRDFILQAIGMNAECFSFASKRLHGDSNFLVEAVEVNWEILFFCKTKISGDYETNFLIAQKTYGDALQFVAPKWLNNKKFILALIKAWEEDEELNFYWRPNIWLNELSERLLSDRDVVLAAVSLNGANLQYVAEKFWSDKEVVLAAVKSGDGYSIIYASKTLQKNREIILAAVSSCPGQFKSILTLSPELNSDREVVLAAVSCPDLGDDFELVAESLRDDKEVVLAAVHAYGFNLKFVSDRLKADKEVVATAMSSKLDVTCAGVLTHAPKRLQRDFELVALQKKLLNRNKHEL
jgi:hypothetical protein